MEEKVKLRNQAILKEKMFEEVYKEMGTWLKGVYPCSTGLVVPALARPEWVVEIEVTAVIPD